MTTYAPETYIKACGIISGRCDACTAESLVPTAHLEDDLAIDSLDLLEIIFQLDHAFGIKLPDLKDCPMVVSELCARIDQQVAKHQVAA